MRRIGLVVALSLIVAALAAEAQPGEKRPRVAMLGGNPMDPTLFDMFKQGLRKAGSTDWHEVLIVEKDAGDVPSRLPALPAELVQDGVAVIFARGPVAVAAAAKATRTIPIVALDLESDPIELGYARTLA